ncbi:MAG: enoyl-acyl carrier protein reductase II [Ignavibacteria bacterium]|nr:MAG: enoyl-acyl carrier protein reductase II [Ignavibacteria bacterium]KAF0161582.1 MAG: enoyl-acyl carrier protein reductase II [Ignavibacteria bacterium]
MNIHNRVTELLKIKHPIIQAGMVWVSGWRLASAVSNNGGLGLIGAGSMKPELLREHIIKCNAATEKSFGVNIPLLRGDVNELMNVVLEEKIKIVFTAAGHPGRHIEQLKKHNLTVIHVVSNIKQALKAESVGCDAIVGEGVEAGGHNGPDEITTFCLIPQLVDAVNIPVIAAGGVADGRGIAAAFSLGADGVQIGTRFAATVESSAHEVYKQSVVAATDNSTTLVLKNIGLVRLIKNNWSKNVERAEANGANEIELKNLLGEKRERLGISEGNAEEGMMEAGQSCGLIKNVLTVNELMKLLIDDFDNTMKKTSGLI